MHCHDDEGGFRAASSHRMKKTKPVLECISHSNASREKDSLECILIERELGFGPLASHSESRLVRLQRRRHD